MKCLSLFSGMGAFDLGLEMAGIEIVGQVEIDPWLRERVLQHHWPQVPKWPDVKTLNAEDFRGRVELVSASPPCQPVSSAGRREGDRDERWLWPDAIRIVSEARPALCVFENPRGLLSHPSSTRIPEMLDKAGYEVLDPIEVGACQVGGVDHGHRVFLVAAARGEGPQGRRKLCSGAGAQEPVPACGGPDRAGQHQDVVAAAKSRGSEAGSVEHEKASASGDRVGSKTRLDALGRGEVRWPARPGHPQFEWEDRRSVEPALVPFADGLAPGLVRRWRRGAHEAVGNSVNVELARVIGLTLMDLYREMDAT